MVVGLLYEEMWDACVCGLVVLFCPDLQLEDAVYKGGGLKTAVFSLSLSPPCLTNVTFSTHFSPLVENPKAIRPV